MPPKREPRPVAGARLQERVTATTSHNPTATRQKPQAPRAFAFQITATGSTPHSATYSVTDGRTTIGKVVRHGHADDRDGARWLAHDARGIRGCFSTMEAAMAALPAVKVRP